MSGLGSARREGNGTFLTVAGGFIWDRKAEPDHPEYNTQEYTFNDEKKTRQGAQYADLTGTVKNVYFKTHDKFGENINVKVEAKSGDQYIFSIKTNTKNSQDMMKLLLQTDLSMPIYIAPYDFVGADNRRAQGISFRQNGEKIKLVLADLPEQFSEFPKAGGDKKLIKRFWEDFNDYLVAEVEENVCSQFKAEDAQKAEAPKAVEAKVEEPKAEEPKAETAKVEKPVAEAGKAPSPLEMKKAIRVYMTKNYPKVEMPALSKEDVISWHALVIAGDELPIVVSEEDLDKELNALNV